MTLAETTQGDHKTTRHYLVIGQGAIGAAVTNCLAAPLLEFDGASSNSANSKAQSYTITGLARQQRSHYALAANAQFIQADARQLTAQQLAPFTHIAIVVTPDRYEAPYYQATYLGIANHLAQLADKLAQLQRLVFISSTGVYGQDNGEWIDASVAPTPPQRAASAYILQAEQVLQQAYGKRAILIRPSGIYGKDRPMRLRQAQKQDKPALPAQAWTNRIMDTDLVHIISNVLQLPDTQAIAPMYLASDYAPVTAYELITWLSQRLGSVAPRIQTQTPSSGKRLHSNIPRAWLQYPDWQAGYTHILTDAKGAFLP